MRQYLVYFNEIFRLHKEDQGIDKCPVEVYYNIKKRHDNLLKMVAE